MFPSVFSQGILGSLKSGKSALVNKYITGSYVAVEKPDGKKTEHASFYRASFHLVELMLVKYSVGVF